MTGGPPSQRRSAMDSRHKGPVIPKGFLCHELLMERTKKLLFTHLFYSISITSLAALLATIHLHFCNIRPFHQVSESHGKVPRESREGSTLSMILHKHWPHFYQTRSAWSKDQGSNENHSPVHNFAPTVTKFCVMWEGQALPQDTKFGNCRDKIVDSRAFLSWSLILGSSWSGLIKLGPGSPSNLQYHIHPSSILRWHWSE